MEWRRLFGCEEMKSKSLCLWVGGWCVIDWNLLRWPLWWVLTGRDTSGLLYWLSTAWKRVLYLAARAQWVGRNLAANEKSPITASLLIICSSMWEQGSWARCSSHLLLVWLSSDWQEKLELWWELILCVESVGEIDSSNSAVGMDLNSNQIGHIRLVKSLNSNKPAWLKMWNRYTKVAIGIPTWESQYSWFHRLFLWNRTSWIESDSIPRRVS